MPACKMGLIWPNASDGMGMLASLSRNECALTALQNHQNISNRPATGEGIAVGYSYCEVSKDCGCLAGSDFCMIWTSLGPPGSQICGEPDPCFCSDYVENLVNFNDSSPNGSSPEPAPPPLPVPTPAGCGATFSCDVAKGTCSPANGTHPGGGNYSSQSSCAAACKRRPPPPPAPPPPPPLAADPCIRFGHTIPVATLVTATMVQEDDPEDSYTWTDYKFGQFSDWVNVFKAGKGTLTVWESVDGKKGAQLYQLSGIPLTPGPSVLVLKVAQDQAFNGTGGQVFWPPREPDNVEMIAASYVQPGTGGKIRLMNLAPDTKDAGMALPGGKSLASNVAFSLGSAWAAAPAGTSSTFEFTDDDDTPPKAIGSVTATLPPAPLGMTNYLIGMQTASGPFAKFKIQAVALVDAPEGGVCKPKGGGPTVQSRPPQ